MTYYNKACLVFTIDQPLINWTLKRGYFEMPGYHLVAVAFGKVKIHVRVSD